MGECLGVSTVSAPALAERRLPNKYGFCFSPESVSSYGEKGVLVPAGRIELLGFDALGFFPFFFCDAFLCTCIRKPVVLLLISPRF